MYHDLTTEPEIIITSEHTRIDGYEFHPHSIVVEMPETAIYPHERVTIQGIISGYDHWNRHLAQTEG